MHSEGSQKKRRINPRSHSFLPIDATDGTHNDI